MNRENIRELILQNTPLIDVRAPVEFQQGHAPGAINLPILNNEERALIGTIYKNEGNAAAVQRGHEIVSGAVKAERICGWNDYIQKYPNAMIYCFRGGQRSQITQHWLSAAGVHRPIVKGGYKAIRNFLLSETSRVVEQNSFLVVSGTTGSGKTHFLADHKKSYRVIDLEAVACHRGSAFGRLDFEQPTQANFENKLAADLIQVESSTGESGPLLIEDESSMIGRCATPKDLFEKMRASKVLWIDEPLEIRVQNIFQDYILDSAIGRNEVHARSVFLKFRNSIQAISKKLGGLRTQELTALLFQAEKSFLELGQLSENKNWIEKLLVYYYDPLYLSSLARRDVKILFKGSRIDCSDFIKTNSTRL